MNTVRWLVAGAVAACLAGCGGDVNLNISNNDNSIDNSVTNPGGGAGSGNPCAQYTLNGTTRQGTYNGTNCIYLADFVSTIEPLTVDVTIPLIAGAHIFRTTLAVGVNVSTGQAPAADSGPTLTIAAGNTIAFENEDDYVLINRGAKIVANGTPVLPITFTSTRDKRLGGNGGGGNGIDIDEVNTVGLWGGIVLNGRGITNACDAAARTANTCHVLAEGKPSHYGGNDNADDSGSLQYVVVKHAGFDVVEGNELNAVTFNAVGSGTLVENLQVFDTRDDGIEFFGGAVNVTNFVALYAGDDSIDFSDGYIGTVENALVIHALGKGNHCVEGDNINAARVGEDFAQTPRSNPTIRNLTCILSNATAATGGNLNGKGDSRGPILREGTLATLENVLVYDGYAIAEGNATRTRSLRIDLAATLQAAQAGLIVIRNSLFAGPANLGGGNNLPNGDTPVQWLTNTGTNGTYAANTGNVINALATTGDGDGYLRGFYAIENNVAPGVTAGGVTEDDDWTQDWTYGLHAGNGPALWFRD